MISPAAFNDLNDSILRVTRVDNNEPGGTAVTLDELVNDLAPAAALSLARAMTSVSDRFLNKFLEKGFLTSSLVLLSHTTQEAAITDGQAELKKLSPDEKARGAEALLLFKKKIAELQGDGAHQLNQWADAMLKELGPQAKKAQKAMAQPGVAEETSEKRNASPDGWAAPGVRKRFTHYAVNCVAPPGATAPSPSVPNANLRMMPYPAAVGSDRAVGALDDDEKKKCVGDLDPSSVRSSAKP